MKTIILAAAVAAAPFAAAAGDLSYTYVEAGWNKVHVDEDALATPEPDGGYIRGSYDLGDGINVFGGVSRISEGYRLLGVDVDVDLTQVELGLGYHQAMGERVDFIAELAWTRLDFDAKAGGFSDGDDIKGGRGAIGVRGRFNESLEALLKVNYYAGGDFEDETFTAVAGAQFRIDPTWGITGEIEHGELLSTGDDTRYMIGVRASF